LNHFIDEQTLTPNPMFKPLFFLFVVLLASCGTNDSQTNQPKDSVPTQNSQSNNDQIAEKAISFINAYVENCNKMNQAVSVTDWVNQSALVTSNFKSELTRITKDDELDADPLLNAQDYPEKGFELDRFDAATNIVTVKGKEDWSDFKLKIQMKKVNDDWLVDGCGMVNMKENK
jgi:hypothetical protein